jgi:hypothetical protein
LTSKQKRGFSGFKIDLSDFCLDWSLRSRYS